MQNKYKKNAAVLAQALIDRGFTIVSGGTDNHSMLVDLRSKYPDLTGKVAEKALVSADITVNKNMVPFDSRSAFQTSGIRLGTPAITTRGAKEDLMLEIAEMIETVLSNVDNEEVIAQVRARVNETMKKYPLFCLLRGILYFRSDIRIIGYCNLSGLFFSKRTDLFLYLLTLLSELSVRNFVFLITKKKIWNISSTKTNSIVRYAGRDIKRCTGLYIKHPRLSLLFYKERRGFTH